MDEQSSKKYPERNPLYLKEWRKYRKLTQKEICELLKVEQPTLSRYEKRVNPIDINTLERLAEIYKVEVSDLILRNPFERYVSGVQTYLRNLEPGYDRDTVLKLISEYLFLNRHFALQFHWVTNFARHSQAWMHFRPIEELHTATEHTFNVLARDKSLIDYFEGNAKLHFYLQLDKVLYEYFMGRTVPFKEILQFIKSDLSYLYNETIGRSKEICSVLD